MQPRFQGNPATWFTAVFSVPIDRAALDALATTPWAAVYDRAVRFVDASRFADLRDAGLPPLPPKVLAGSLGESPPIWFAERSLARCANDADAACVWLVKHALDFVTGAGDGCQTASNRDDDAELDAGLYDAAGIGGGKVLLDLHVGTAVPAGETGARTKKAHHFSHDAGDNHGNFRENLSYRFSTDPQCAEIFLDGTACDAGGVAITAAVAARLRLMRERRLYLSSGLAAPLPFSELPSRESVKAFGLSVRGVPYFIERWVSVGASLLGLYTPHAMEVEAASHALAAEGSGPSAPLYTELDRTYFAHGAPRVVRLTPAGLQGRSAAAAEIALRALGAPDRAVVYDGALHREPVLSVVAQLDGNELSVAVHVSLLAPALGDVISAAVKIGVEDSKSPEIVAAGVIGWLRDGDPTDLGSSSDSEPVRVLLYVPVDNSPNMYLDAELTRHPDPVVNSGSFATYGLARSPGAGVLLRICALERCGQSIHRRLVYSSDFRRSLQHLRFAMENSPNEGTPQVASLYAPRPQGLQFEVGNALDIPVTWAASTTRVQRAVTIGGPGAGGGTGAEPPLRCVLETHAALRTLSSLLPAAALERWEFWLRTPFEHSRTGGSPSGRLSHRHMTRVLLDACEFVGYPRYETPGAGTTSATGGGAPDGAANSVGFLESQLAHLRIDANGRASLSCAASSHPAADAAASRRTAATIAGAPESSVRVSAWLTLVDALTAPGPLAAIVTAVTRLEFGSHCLLWARECAVDSASAANWSGTVLEIVELPRLGLTFGVAVDDKTGAARLTSHDHAGYAIASAISARQAHLLSGFPLGLPLAGGPGGDRMLIVSPSYACQRVMVQTAPFATTFLPGDGLRPPRARGLDDDNQRGSTRNM